MVSVVSVKLLVFVVALLNALDFALLYSMVNDSHCTRAIYSSSTSELQ
jgi:hypothetical protein